MPGVDYVVVVVAPAGSSFTSRDVGGDDAVDSDVFPGGSTNATTPVSGDNFDVGDAGLSAPTIGDFVWLDPDGDGVQDPGEPGLEGVTVELFDSTGSTLIGSTTTDVNGNYGFVVPDFTQDYVVRVTPPSGGLFTSGPESVVDAAGEVVVSPLPGANDDVDAGVVPASIGDFVFVDLDDDGLQDVGELGVGGVTVQLWNPFGVLLDSTSTAGDGGYSFDGLVPGADYVVVVVAPAGSSFTSRDVGGDDAVDSDVFPGGSTNVITPVSGDNFDVGDAGLSAPTIGDFVWLDSDGDGVQDPGEPGLVGVTVELFDSTGSTLIGSTTTDVNGNYGFVVPDFTQDYVVRVTPPSGGLFTSGPESVVDAAGEVVVSPLPGANDDVDAGVIPKPSLAGTVLDENGAPIEGVELTIDDGAGFTTTTLTVVDGSYRFDDLDPGTYTVTESQPAGYGDVSTSAGSVGGDDSVQNEVSGVVLTPGALATGYDFVEGFSSIAGSVFEDVNNNGVRDGGEFGLAGVDVTLNGTDPNGAITAVTVSTDVDGDYVFDDLLAGTYVVTEPTQPAGLLDGTDVAGSAGGTAVNPGDEINSISLDPGEDATGYDFGEIDGGLVSGNVSDVNGAPIVGVTLTLSGSDDLGSVTPVVVVTDVDGNYVFSDLRPGTYTVVESQPAGFGEGGESTDDTGATTSTNTIAGLTLAVGGTSVNNDFVEIYSSIAGHVFLDVDGDGVYDVGLDVPLPGESVTLTGTDPDGAVGPVSATTNAAGEWIFDDLLAGTYAVAEIQPAAFDDGLDSLGSEGGTLGNDLLSAIALPAGTDAVDYAFGEVPASSVSGNVSDVNGAPIVGVTLTLTGVDSFGTSVAPVVVVTDVDGDFVFSDVAPGVYTVTESQPAGYGDVSTSAGSVGGDDSVENVVSAITIGTTTVAAGYDFVEGFSSIAGSVFEDVNNNGVRDGGEFGLAGVDVTLNGTDPNGAITAVTVSTDVDGDYVFDDLLAGTYVVTEPTQPAGLLDGTDVAGSAGGTAVNPGDEINSISLDPGEDATGYDFGEIDGGLVSGNVSDVNGAPIVGVTLTLSGSDDLGSVTPVVVVTDVDGNYVFSDLRPGTYTVTQTQPASYGDGSQSSPTGDVSTVNVIASIPVAAGGSAPANDFVETLSSIGGTVYLDVNENGELDAGEPRLAGVTVRLDGSDENGAISQVVTMTDADGNYRFDDLLAGTYVVTEETPAELNDGLDAAGSVGGTALNPGDEINSIPLPAGTDAVDYDFGELGTIITGTVFLDDDRNGAIGSAEEIRLGGIEITLLDETGTEIASTTTAPDGTYGFGDLAAGEYTIVQSQPDGYGSTTPNEIDVDLPNVGLTEVDFGEDLGSIGDYVFADLDGDGVQDADESGFGGVTVRLFGADGDEIAVTTSGSRGRYAFDRLAPGTYRLAFEVPVGSALTENGQGPADADSDPDWITGRTATIELGADATTGLVDRRTDIDAGVVDEVIDLSITVAIDKNTANVGDRVTYTLTPVNGSKVPVVDGAKVVFELPAAVSAGDVDAPGWSVRVVGNTATLTIDRVLLPGDPLPVIEIGATVVDASAATTAQVTISTVNGAVETTLSNNSDEAAFTVPVPVPVTVPQQPSDLPRTGSELGRSLMPAALALVLIGAAMQFGVGRRRAGGRNRRTTQPA